MTVGVGDYAIVLDEVVVVVSDAVDVIVDVMVVAGEVVVVVVVAYAVEVVDAVVGRGESWKAFEAREGGGGRRDGARGCGGGSGRR